MEVLSDWRNESVLTDFHELRQDFNPPKPKPVEQKRNLCPFSVWQKRLLGCQQFYQPRILGIHPAIFLRNERLKRGIEFSEDELALDVIARIRPGGSFIVEPHTMKRMKSVALLTKLSDRGTRTPWERKGALDTHARAAVKVREIFSRDSSAVFSPEVDARIRAEFKNLVAGKLEMPEGW